MANGKKEKEKQFEPKVNFKPEKASDDIVPIAGGVSIVKNSLVSRDYIQNEKGYKIDSDGTIESNGSLKLGNKLESTNFKKLTHEPISGVAIYLSDETTPNGNLTAPKGSMCLNSSATGQIAYNTDGASAWTLL